MMVSRSLASALSVAILVCSHCWMWCMMVSRSLAPALSVAILVCSHIRAATIPAGSALFMVVLMLVRPGFAVVILLD